MTSFGQLSPCPFRCGGQLGTCVENGVPTHDGKKFGKRGDLFRCTKCNRNVLFITNPVRKANVKRKK